MKWLHRHGNAVALAIGLIATLALVEATLRVVEPWEMRVHGDRIRLPVNQRYELRNHFIPGLDSLIIHTKNSLGFRGPEPPSEWTSSLTILAIGGSTTECFYLPDGQSWPEVLYEQLQGKFSNLWINNAGLNGHSTFGHLFLMDQFVVDLKPKVVLFLVGVNDVERADLRDYDASVHPEPSGPLMRLVKRSEIYAVIVAATRRVRTIQQRVAHGRIKVENLPTANSTRRLPKLLAEQTSYLDGYEERLRALLTTAKSHGIQPVLLTQPAVYGVGIDDQTGVDLARIVIDGKKGLDGETRWAILERYNDVTRRVGRDESVLVIDLARRLPKSTRLFYDWYHFTTEGAEEVATLVTRELRPWLSEHFVE